VCGRFALRSATAEAAGRLLGLTPPPDWVSSRFNIPPGTGIPVILAGASGGPEWGRAEWGFRPRWAQPDAPKPINARAETVATSKYFRDAFAHRRCLVPADGWYEWQASDERKQPWFIAPAEDESAGVLFLAGIWEPSAEDAICCAIVTEPARPPLDRIHHRQPLALDEDCLRGWLDPALTDRTAIRSMVRRFPTERLRCHPVSAEVNRPGNDHEGLLSPVAPLQGEGE
jgi:putative SOS response-associated peptidase YedK